MLLVPALSHCLSVVRVPRFMLYFPDLSLFPLTDVRGLSAFAASPCHMQLCGTPLCDEAMVFPAGAAVNAP